jgi:transcriptional regulator with XRE-family HTH domain
MALRFTGTPVSESSTFYRPSGTGTLDNGNMGKDVGMRLRYVRKELRGWTQQELAKASGVKQTTISDLETGESRSPVGTNLVSLAQSLQVNPDWLATGKGDMQPMDVPLPPKAILLARDWMKLAPEVQESVHDMIRKMVKASSADVEPVPDAEVAAAYGKPGAKKRPSKN